jgi:hypothetical protein
VGRTLLEGGREDLTLEELLSLEAALERHVTCFFLPPDLFTQRRECRSRAVVMKRIATLSLKKEIEEKNKCSVQCSPPFPMI